MKPLVIVACSAPYERRNLVSRLARRGITPRSTISDTERSRRLSAVLQRVRGTSFVDASDGSEMSERPAHFVQSVQRALDVIRAFDAEHRELTLSDVARRTGLTRAAARRFLLTLVDLGYVRTDDRSYTLTPRVLELGYAYLSSLSLPEVAAPHQERLAAEARESSSISVLDGDNIVYVSRVATSRIMTVAISVGTRFPAYATSMGRVLLAGLDEAELDAYLQRVELCAMTRRTVTDRAELRRIVADVRSKGWAIVDQELEEGLRSSAAPLHDRSGTIVAAINVSTHSTRTSLSDLRRRIVPLLLATAERIESEFALTGTTASRPAAGA